MPVWMEGLKFGDLDAVKWFERKADANPDEIFSVLTHNTTNLNRIYNEVRDGLTGAIAGSEMTIEELNESYALLAAASSFIEVPSFSTRGGPRPDLGAFQTHWEGTLGDYPGGELGNLTEDTLLITEDHVNRWASQADRLFKFKSENGDEFLPTEVKTSRSEQAHAMNISFKLKIQNNGDMRASIKETTKKIMREELENSKNEFDYIFDHVFGRFTVKFINLLIMNMESHNRKIRKGRDKGQFIGPPYVSPEDIVFYKGLIYADEDGRFSKKLFYERVWKDFILPKSSVEVKLRRNINIEATQKKEAKTYFEYIITLKPNFGFEDYAKLYKEVISYERTHSVPPNEAAYPHGATAGEINEFDHIWQFLYAYHMDRLIPDSNRFKFGDNPHSDY